MGQPNDTTVDTDTRPFVPTEHDEIVGLEDGRALRLLVEHDPDTDINDYDCYGKVAWVGRDRNTGLPSNRPEGFNGRARKLWTRSDSFWWQPPSDVRDEDLRDMAHHVSELVEYGFRCYVVELLGQEEDTDAVGHRPVLGVNALGGVDTEDPSYVQEIVGDMARDLLGGDDGDADDLIRY